MNENAKAKMIKLLGESTTLELAMLLGYNTKSKTKEKTGKLDFIKNQTLCAPKVIIKTRKRGGPSVA